MIYIVLILLFILGGFFDAFVKEQLSDKKQNSVYYIYFSFLCLVLTLFRSLRWRTGTDWDSYYYVFDRIRYLNFSSFSGYMEKGYIYLNFLVSKVCDNYTFFLFVFNGIIIIFTAKAIRKINYHPLLMLCLWALVGTLFPVRMHLACSIIIYGYTFIQDKKLIPFVLCVLLASTFHITSLICLPLYFIARKSFSDRFVIVCFVLAVALGASTPILISLFEQILSITGGSFISNKISTYLKLVASDAPSILQVISAQFTRIFFLVTFLYLRKRIELKRRVMFNVFFNIYIVGLIFNRLFYSFSIFSRIYTYFAFAEVVLLTFLLMNLKHKKRLVVFSILILYLLLFRFYANLNNYPELVFPYTSVFDYNLL